MINDALLKAVEGELDGAHCRLRFADDVEARFEADTQRQRSRNMVLAGVISAIIYCLFLINDYSFRPEAFATAVQLRMGVMLPFGLPILWWVYRGVSPVLRETMMASTVIVATVVSCLIFTKSVAPYSYLDVFSFGLILLVGNIVYSLRFGYACASSAASIVIILAFVLPYEPMPVEAKRLAIFTIIAIGVFSLVANYRFELSERTSYLHVLKEKIRAGYYLKDNQKLSQLSITDPLTNLANRRQLDAVLPVRWKEAIDKGTYIGLMMIDIDHFKAYNDFYGHPQGDICLQQVAKAMHDSIRASVEALCIPNFGVSHQAYITVSVGVAVLWPTDELTPADLLSTADRALYEAKRQGRNVIHLANLAGSPSDADAADGLGRLSQ